MQATLCDNCEKPAGTPLQMDGWRKVARLKLHKIESDDSGPPHPLRALLGGAPGGGDHIDLEEEHDLCSDACLLAFVGNGYQQSFVGLADDLTPDQFAEATTAEPPPEDGQG